MSKYTPKHFSSSKRFLYYVYDAAARDLKELVKCYTPDFRDPDEDEKKIIDETIAEIKAIEARMKRIKI